jgi:hypothetical protein
MNKRFRIYFKNNSEVGIVIAHRFEVDSKQIKFYKAEEGDADPETYVSTDAVAAIMPVEAHSKEPDLPGTTGYRAY